MYKIHKLSGNLYSYILLHFLAIVYYIFVSWHPNFYMKLGGSVGKAFEVGKEI